MKFMLALLALGTVLAAADDFPILTPLPGPAPAIHGPTVYGVRPGRPFLYRIPCTGTRPMKFSADGLPAGLQLDAATGIISGTAPGKAGSFVVTLRSANAKGKASRKFRIQVGDTLALTPPMGWNDWYTHYDRVTDKLMRQAADAMIASGMADFGYQYVNIDDCWMVKPGSPDPELGGPARDPKTGAMLTNRRFPDMKGLTAYIHDKGLKAGLYTSPGPLTCAKFEGSYQHEEQDAKQFAEWGFDFLKYDWCGYNKIAPKPQTLEQLQTPYRLMGSLLAKLPRDLVLNFCQYGMGDVWKWGKETGGQCWRTTGDLGLEKDTELPGFYSIAFKNAQQTAFAGPGAWNDPDYLLIGVIGNAHKISEAPKRTTLTAHEQYSYMSLWALMASPLFFSGDMGALDPFTLNVLCNAEVIEIDQDALGKQARVVRRTPEELVLAKPLEDGSLAVGVFNLTKSARSITASRADLKMDGKPRRVRDLWRQTWTGSLDAAGWTARDVAPHGVALVRLAAR